MVTLNGNVFLKFPKVTSSRKFSKHIFGRVPEDRRLWFGYNFDSLYSLGNHFRLRRATL